MNKERAQVAGLVKDTQEATNEKVEVAFADQVTPGKTPQTKRPSEEFAWLWSSSTQPRKALSFCPGVGWANAPLPGAPASVASPETTNVCPSSLAELHRLAFLTLMLNSISNQSA